MATPFVHSVYFWLRPDLSASEHDEFNQKVNALLMTPGVLTGHVGAPAGTNRPVIDSSFSFNLLLVFQSREDHDAYQTTDATHQDFIKSCQGYWTRVLVYDAVRA